MLNRNLCFTYSYIPELDLHYLFLDILLDGTRKSRALNVSGEPCVKNFHWRITLPLVCNSSLASLPEKAAKTSTGTFTKQGINVHLSLGRNDGWEVLLQGLNSRDNLFLLSVIECSLCVPVLM